MFNDELELIKKEPYNQMKIKLNGLRCYTNLLPDRLKSMFDNEINSLE
jgi:hypothetical protein